MSRKRALTPGAVIGPYQIEKPLGQGGMGAVLLARHRVSGARHALKVIHRSRLDGRGAERLLARFRREAEVLARIDGHPGIVRVHAAGADEGTPWCAMEYIEGVSLGEMLRDGPLPARRAAELIVEVARAIDHAHAHRVLHRDLKPENVIVDRAGRPHVVDFGLAYDAVAEQLTHTGECLGTPSFMAPEQVGRRSASDEGDLPLGPGTDVYGLGGTFYAALTAHAPFEGKSPLSLMADIVRKMPPPPRAHVPDLPLALQTICLCALAKTPAERYPSAAAFADDVERWLAGESVVASTFARRWAGLLGGRAARAVAAVVAVGLVVGAVVLVARGGAFAVPPRKRLARVVRAIEDTGAPPPGGAAELAALAALPEVRADAELARRVTVASMLTSVLDSTPDDARPVLGALAKEVRPEGAVDQALLLPVARSLHRAGRFEQLDAILHGADPVVPVPPELAGALARAMVVADGERLEPPIDRTAWGALLRVPLTHAERGRLHVRRAAALLRTGESAHHPQALELLVDAFADHGVAADGRDWPEPFVRHALQRFARLTREKAARARDLADLLVRARVGATRPIAPDLVVELQELAGLSSMVGAVGNLPDERTTQTLIEVAPLLEALGCQPMPSDKLAALAQAVPRERLEQIARRELERPADRRCPARLLVLALLIDIETDVGDARILPFVEGALACGVEAVWLHREAAALLGRCGRWEQAREQAERAVALDAERPPALREVFAPEQLAAILLESERAGGARDLARASRLALQAAAVQEEVTERLSAISTAGGMAPWPQIRERRVATVLYRIAQERSDAGVSVCCPADAPTVDEVAEGALRMLARPSARLYSTFDAKSVDTNDAEVLAVRAAHRANHGDATGGLADIDAALLWARRQPSLPNGAPAVAPARVRAFEMLRQQIAALAARRGR